MLFPGPELPYLVSEPINEIKPAIPPLNQTDQTHQKEHSNENHDGVQQCLLALSLFRDVDIYCNHFLNLAVAVEERFGTTIAAAQVGLEADCHCIAVLRQEFALDAAVVGAQTR
jgi:hypothetical protein